MNKGNHQITADEARAALESLDAANKTTVNSLKPPLWLILLGATSLGIKTTAMGLMINNDLWITIQWVSYAVLCLSIISWLFALRMKGIKVKFVAVNIAKLAIIAALFICVLLVLSRAIYLQTGSILFPCIAGILNALILALSLYFGLRLQKTQGETNE